MGDVANEMQVFQRVVTRGSFAGAADDLGLSPSAISKLISRLEQRLGVRLINRSTRRLAPTQEGELYYQSSRDVLRAIEAAEAEIASTRTAPRGQLRVHAFPTFAVDHLSAALPDFLTRYPRINFDFLVTNRAVNLLAENIDVALRVGQLTDSTMVARRISELTQVVCASPKYLARHGRPLQPSDLRKHACLTLSHFPGANKWTFRRKAASAEVNVLGPVSADSAHMLLRLAIEGVGIVRFGDNVVAHAIRAGLLEPLLQDWEEPENFPLWAILPPGRQRPPKVKVFLDFLAERFGSAPWRRAHI
jgi:DNA-binding transcriptional LysR family regulator